MSWLFSQALVGEYLGDICLDGEPSAQSNGKHIQQAYCSPDKMTEYSRLSRFGMMFKPLTENRGEELLMLYREGFHAKTSLPQEKEQALTENGQECGKRWQGLLARLDPNTLLWKTVQCSLLEDSEQSLEIWPNWGSMRNGECWEQTTPTYLTEENEYGCWLPTPVTSMWRGASSKRYYKSPDYKGSFLTEWVRMSKTCAQYFNPDYLEPIMGFPLKWTELNPLEMHKYQLWQQLHGTSLKED